MINSLWRSKAFVKVWQATLCLFGLSILISKSGLSIFGALLAVFAIVGLDWKKFFKEEKLAAAILMLYPLAILCGFFSLGGVQSGWHVAAAWPWPLLVLPTLIVKSRPDDARKFFFCLALGLAVACLKCFYNFATQYQGVFDATIRFTSFWDISRWGLFSGFFLMMLVAYLSGKNRNEIMSSWKLKGLWILLLATLACVILSNNRGPWLAFAISCGALFVLYPRSWKVIVPVLILFACGFSFSKGLTSRLSSIVEVQTQNGQVVSKDPSNSGRLSMWKVALDFCKEQFWFGTGFDNSETPLRSFLERQSPEYRDKYLSREYSYRDQHSSFLTFLVQMGAVFSLAFWFVIFFAALTWLPVWWKSKSLYASAILSLMIFHFVLCVFYTSFLSYEIVTFLPLLVLRRDTYVNA